MSFLTIKPVLDVLTFVLAASGAVALGARLFKRWQTADVAHVIWNAFGLVSLALFSYFITQGYATAQFQVVILISAVFCVLSLYRSADRIRRRHRGQFIRRNRSLDSFIIVLYLTGIGSVFFVARSHPPPTPIPPLATLPVWRPQVAQVNQLGQEVYFEQYGVRPPPGFTLVQQQEQARNATGIIYKWRNALRHDGTRTVFEVNVAHPLPGYYPNDDLASVLQQDSALIGRTHDQFVTSGIQFGKVQGIAFGRLYWKGIWKRNGKETHGFIYLTITPGAVITVYASDAEPYQQTTLPLCESAALTLQKT